MNGIGPEKGDFAMAKLVSFRTFFMEGEKRQSE
jgi:hypothetical protein